MVSGIYSDASCLSQKPQVVMGQVWCVLDELRENDDGKELKNWRGKAAPVQDGSRRTAACPASRGRLKP
ncbi:hypothetical protein C9417_26450 [Rhizobium sp. SEMIA 4088]|nr:hypothetical protein C9417_26450 [Rhizobium sp. SEMIA 4088]